MTTSGDTTFDLSRDEIIADALANVGAIGPGVTPRGRMLDHAVRCLERVVKAIDADGGFLWRTARRTQSTTDGDGDYTLGTDVLNIDEPLNYKRSGENSRSPIRLISRDDWMAITDRTQEGVPTLAFVEYALPTTVTLNLWPIPDATGDSIEYAAVLRAQEYDAGSYTGDFPARWLNCLLYGLSAELATPYGQPRLAQSMRQMFVEEKARQLAADGEKGGTRLVPFGSWWSY